MAASTGKFDVTPTAVKADNQCEFGKWLYGTQMSASEKQSPHYAPVKQLHAQFHQEAAKVVELATAGKKIEAEKAIAIGSSYTKVSTSLTSEIVKWRESLR
jgi:hypothetical protein